MIPRRIPNPRTEPVDAGIICAIANKWGVQPLLIHRLTEAQRMLPFDLWIFSGARDREEQEALRDEPGSQAAPFELSTHADTDERGCPRLATGADVQPADAGIRVITAAVAQMGMAVTLAGLRWGGGSPVDEAGIPSDRWHVDLGPRSTHP